MNEEKSILIRIDDDGNASLYKEPYATVEVQTEEEFEFLKKVTALYDKLEKYRNETSVDTELDPSGCPKKLLALMALYPELPIVPLVDTNSIEDLGIYQIAKFGSSFVGDYVLGEDDIDYYRKMYLKSDYDKGSTDGMDVLYDILGDEKVDTMSEEELDAAFENLPWKTAILVYIEKATWEVDD